MSLLFPGVRQAAPGAAVTPEAHNFVLLRDRVLPAAAPRTQGRHQPAFRRQTFRYVMLECNTALLTATLNIHSS